MPQRTIGCLYVQVDLSKNNDVLEPLYDYGATWAVYASDGTRLCCDDQYPDIQLDLQSYGEESTQIVKNAGAEKYMVSVSAGENGNFYVAAVYPLRLMWQEPVWNLLPYLVLTVIILAVAFYFIDRYSKLLSDPLSQLADMMQKTTLDNLKQPHHFYTENLPDEIISLYQSYSVMSDRITDMVQDKINWMKKMAEQRYRYLQYQINPHFLYNTLNVIGIMGEEAGQRSVFEACKTLTHLLRYSLVDFMKPSTFQEEFSSIHAYLNLMKLRFEHKVSYDIVYDQGLDRYCLPRFSIQPFVENVFEHAFDDEHGQVTILIRGEIRDDRWVITIRDNGKGFDSVKADRIQAYIVRYMEHMKDSDIQFQSEDGIGIINTVTRLMVYFRQDFSYGILSNPEGGCTIELSGALKWKEQA